MMCMVTDERRVLGSHDHYLSPGISDFWGQQQFLLYGPGDLQLLRLQSCWHCEEAVGSFVYVTPVTPVTLRRSGVRDHVRPLQFQVVTFGWVMLLGAVLFVCWPRSMRHLMPTSQHIKSVHFGL